jgi:hypothetical protein
MPVPPVLNPPLDRGLLRLRGRARERSKEDDATREADAGDMTRQHSLEHLSNPYL